MIIFMKGICVIFVFINIFLTFDFDVNECFILMRIDWLELVVICILGYKNCCCIDMWSWYGILIFWNVEFVTRFCFFFLYIMYRKIVFKCECLILFSVGDWIFIYFDCMKYIMLVVFMLKSVGFDGYLGVWIDFEFLVS